MIISIQHGNVLEFPADVLITSANPWLTMSSGVNGEIIGRCGMSMQEELNAYLNKCGLKAVPGGTVVPTQALGLPFKHVIHAVAVDAFEDSSEVLVAKTLQAAFQLVQAFAVDSVSLPPLATGYGPISLKSFASALRVACQGNISFVEKMNVIVESQDDVEQVKESLADLTVDSSVEVR